MLGGVALVAKALRVIEKTTTMRVKEVIITKIDGASDKTVIIMMILKIRPVAEPVGVSDIFKLTDCANAESLNINIVSNKTALKYKVFLIISGSFPRNCFGM